MSSSPTEGVCTISVKRVANGLVSNHIYNSLKIGDLVEVMPPQGRFTPPLSIGQSKTYFLFGAGSGITPLFSILKSILEEEPMSQIKLLYGNRNEDSIIFKSELDFLERKYKGQIEVEHILSQPKIEKKGSWLFGKKTTSWTGKIGRCDAKVVSAFLGANPITTKDGAEYFICGPESMMMTIENVLKTRNVEQKRIHVEHFLSASNTNNANNVSKGEGARLTVHLNGKRLDFQMEAGKTVLDTLVAHKVDVPYSCTAGACSTCMAKITKGEGKMGACFSLDPEEIAEGYVLTCQLRPTTETLEITYDF
jgi:ring-1,2-phenylacetyl-CoA epoxidase subunit PaaE